MADSTAIVPPPALVKSMDFTADVQRITRRIDSIGDRHPGVAGGLSWYYIRLILMTGIGWAMDSMETFIFIYVGGYIQEDIAYSDKQGSFLAGAAFVGSFFGSFLFGSLADKYGRRPMFMVTLLVFILGLTLCGTAWNITSLTIFRIFGGIGLGGELPVLSTLVQELSPKKTRGRIIVLLEAFWAVGCMLAVALAYGVAPHTGWRELFYLCTIPAVYSAVVRLTVPESPKWLASVGRMDEAIAVVEKIERAHGLEPYDEKKEVESEVEPTSTFKLPDSHIGRIQLLFGKQFLVRTLALWTLWFGISMSYYAIFIFLPALIAETGYDINGSWERILLITAFQLPGYFSAAYLLEKLGRRITLIGYLMVTFAFAIALAYVEPTAFNVTFTASGLAFFMLGAWGCVYAYTPENYPTAIRGIGAAYPSGFSRIGAFSGPYLCSDMLSWGVSLEAILWIFGGILVLISAVIWVFGFEPKGKDVESYGEDEDEKALKSAQSGHFKEVTTPI